MWRNRLACSSIAATTFGWEWPVVTTAIPAVKSRNRLPSTSVTQQPSPLSMSPSFTRSYPFVMDRGEGCWVTDVGGNRFLDFTAGIAVVTTDHSHPKVV